MELRENGGELVHVPDATPRSVTRAPTIAIVRCCILALGIPIACRAPESTPAAGHASPPRAERPAPSATAKPATRAETASIEVTVKQVIDGDTLLVTGLPKGTEPIRLIGVNAPETGNGRTIRECFGKEAARWLSDQVPRGTRLRLVFDVGRRDRFGRVLAYAYRPDGTFLNAALVASGYAQVMTIQPNVRHAKELLALQRVAARENRGLWGECASSRRTSRDPR